MKPKTFGVASLGGAFGYLTYLASTTWFPVIPAPETTVDTQLLVAAMTTIYTAFFTGLGWVKEKSDAK